MRAPPVLHSAGMLSLPLAALASVSAAGLVGGVLATATVMAGPATPLPRAAASAASPAVPGSGATGTTGPVTTHRAAARGDPAATGAQYPTAQPRPPLARRWRWPLPPTPRVVRGFDPPAQRWLAGHRGVDLAAVPGDIVVAAGAGVVTFAGPVAGRGVVTVTHGDLRTTYEPVTATVDVGDVVAAGDPIGTLAAGAGHCGGYPTCLHWGLLRGGTYLDPLSLLGLSHPVLLPIPNP